MKRHLGHVRERPEGSGRWAIVVSVLDAETGQRKRIWHTFPAERGKTATQREAQAELNRLLSEINGGTYLEPSRTTLATFLDKWLDHIKAHVAPRSHERYAEIARKNIAPLLGNVMLTKLQPAQISGAYATALASGRRNGKGGLSPRTVSYMHRVLRQALEQAVRWQLLLRNPADAVTPPKCERKPVAVIDADETAALIEAARSMDYFMPILLGALCGLRRGEITALRRRSVDLDRGQLAVVASTEQLQSGAERSPSPA
jgi:integrase